MRSGEGEPPLASGIRIQEGKNMTQKNNLFKFHVLSAGLEPDKSLTGINKSDFSKIEIVSCWNLEGCVGMTG
jgi:hypothetical protein